MKQTLIFVSLSLTVALAYSQDKIITHKQDTINCKIIETQESNIKYKFPNEDAVNDYEKCFETLFEYVDYFVVNVSSPNTPGLRALQDKEPLTKLLLRVKELNSQKKNYEFNKIRFDAFAIWVTIPLNFLSP